MAETVHRYKEFNLTQLRVFREFLQQKSFADTARVLGVSESAVWQQMRALERRFGVALLQRYGRSLRPSEDGQALLDLVADILRSVDSLDDVFRQLRGDLPREVRVLATPGAAAGELAGPVAEIKRRHPNTRIEISLAWDLDQAVEALLSGDADLALLTTSLIGSVRRRSLEILPVRTRPAGVLVPRGHPLLSKPRFSLEDLVAYPLILPTRSFISRQRLDEVFRAAGLEGKMRVSVEVSLLQAIEEYVRRKVGIGITPHVADWKPAAGVKSLPASHLFPPDELFLLRCRGKRRPQVLLLEELLLQPCS